MGLDLKIFFMTATLDDYKYMRMPLTLFPKLINKQYNLNTHSQNGSLHVDIHWAEWGLPQASILTNKLLQKCLAPHGYYECVNTPGL